MLSRSPERILFKRPLESRASIHHWHMSLIIAANGAVTTIRVLAQMKVAGVSLNHEKDLSKFLFVIQIQVVWISSPV